MHFRSRCSGPLVTFVFLAIASSSYANGLKEMTVKEMYAASELIIVGKVRSVSGQNCPQDVVCAEVSVERVLKGHLRKTIFVTVGGLIIAEAKPECCAVGATYLFYLQRYDPLRWARDDPSAREPAVIPGPAAMESVDGSFGIVKLSDPDK